MYDRDVSSIVKARTVNSLVSRTLTFNNTLSTVSFVRLDTPTSLPKDYYLGHGISVVVAFRFFASTLAPGYVRSIINTMQQWTKDPMRRTIIVMRGEDSPNRSL